MKKNRIITINPTKILTMSSVACAALIAALACDDTATDVPAPGLPDSGAQAGGGSSNQDDGGANGNAGAGGTGGSATDAGDAAAVCEIDTAAAVDGCDGETIDIAGEYDDGFATVSIESCSIYGNPLTTLSNADHYMVTQNPCDDLFSPGKWSRYDWTMYSGDGGTPELYLCTQVYDADSEAAAIAAPSADDADPTTGGCGTPPTTFPWSKLTALGGAGPDAGDAGSDDDAGNVPADAAADAGDGG